MIWPIDSLKDTPEYLAPVADQAAWELAATACLEHLVTPSERSGFDIASPEGKLSTDAMCCSGYWRFSQESCRAKQRPGISC
ncbi:hypothetical protein ACX1JO_002375 [Cronobacter dublinensis]